MISLKTVEKIIQTCRQSLQACIVNVLQEDTCTLNLWSCLISCAGSFFTRGFCALFPPGWPSFGCLKALYVEFFGKFLSSLSNYVLFNWHISLTYVQKSFIDSFFYKLVLCLSQLCRFAQNWLTWLTCLDNSVLVFKQCFFLLEAFKVLQCKITFLDNQENLFVRWRSCCC